MMKKQYIVTGGCGAIGTALTRQLVARGDTAVVFDCVEPRAPVEGVTYHTVDLANMEATRTACAAIIGQVEGVFHLAGQMKRGTLFDADEAEWDALFSVHVKALWMMLTALMQQLESNASIVIMSSRHGVDVKADPGLYALVKATLIPFARIIQKTKPAWRVAALGLGPVDTPLHRTGRPPEEIEQERVDGVLLTAEEAAARCITLTERTENFYYFDDATQQYVWTELMNS